MGLVGRALSGARIGTLDPWADRYYEPAGMVNATGIPITPDTALRISTAFACVSLISESLGMLPLIVYRRRSDGGKDRAPDHPLYEILHDTPNPWQTAIEFLSMMQAHLCLRGNAYAEIVPGPRGLVDQLIPRHPDRIRPEEMSDGTLRYRWRQPNGTERVFLSDEMFHMRGLSLDGKTGLSVISYAAQSMGLAAAAEDYGARFFGSGARPAGLLKTTGKLSQDAAERMEKRWKAAYGGVANSQKVAVMEEGLEFQAMGFTPEDSQMLQTREFQAADVARWFRVPLHMVQLTTPSTSWGSGIEQMGLGFVIYTLGAWLVRWEQKIRKDLMLAPGAFTAEFLVDSLLRGNTAERYAAYQTAAGGNAPWMSRNDIRRRENMNPLPGLDEILQPLNMGQSGGPPGGKTGTGLAGRLAGGADQLAATFARDAAERVARREVAALSRAARRAGADEAAWDLEVERFYGEHAAYVVEAMHVSAENAEAYAWEQATFLKQSGPDTLGDKFIRVSASRLVSFGVMEGRDE